MKKIAFLFLSVLCVNILVAQDGPTIPTITSGKWWSGASGTGEDGRLTGSDAYSRGYTTRSKSNTDQENPVTRAPLAPATLLLLGLGGAAVGTTVLKNTRKK